MVIKKIIISAALLTGMMQAQAQELYYSFKWTGFISEYSLGGGGPEWRPDLFMTGFFRGEDINNDNIIGITEITKFGLYDIDFFGGCPQSGPGVWGDSNCALSTFSYELGGTLAFQASYQKTVDGAVYSSTSFNAPFSSSSSDDWGGSSTLLWTPDTQFQITSSVPEPGSLGMLLGGLAGIAAFARMRAKHQA